MCVCDEHRPSCAAAGIDPYDKDATAPSELVSFTGSFHGRTLGSLILTYKVHNRTRTSRTHAHLHIPQSTELDKMDPEVAISMVKGVCRLVQAESMCGPPT